MAYQRRTTKRPGSRRGRFPSRTNVWVRNFHRGTAGTPVTNWGYELLPNNVLDPGARVGSTVIRAYLHVLTGVASPLANQNGGFYVGVAVVNIAEWADPALPPMYPEQDSNGVDWMYWGWHHASDNNVGHVVYNTPATAEICSVKLDIKAKRRITAPNENLVASIQAIGETYPNGLNIWSSTLIKLA